ncbi:ribonuclease HII [Candidatus Woesearchaeota archaeon]|nr:ribonuclease HII [Candidatus Woesearchaeota archaeon]
MKIAGIEEAGRGPVIGPLVVCGILIAEQDEEKLKAIKVKDSKLLTPKQRETLYPKIIDIVKKKKILILQPAEIDAALSSDSLNLNWLEAHKMADILNVLQPDRAFIDCPSNNIKAFRSYLRELLEKQMGLVVEHKADVHYPIVSAASILAKVTRDSEVAKIQKMMPEDFGSGYMTDPRTAAFLAKYYDTYPDIFRKQWVSYQSVMKSKNQLPLGAFEGRH